MKRMLFILCAVALVITACAAPANNAAPDTNAGNAASDENNTGNSGNAGEPNANNDSGNNEAPLPTNLPTCYPDGNHPIAENIADQYAEITTYEEIMVWFCNGALFDDILTALTTEELTGADAEELLHMLAAGTTWQEIWLALGVTEE